MTRDIKQLVWACILMIVVGSVCIAGLYTQLQECRQTMQTY